MAVGDSNFSKLRNPTWASGEPVVGDERSADALKCLKKVVRSGWRKEWIKHDPDWTALRDLRESTALVS